MDNKWSAYFAGMQLISRYNTVIWFLQCAIDIYSKYACVTPWKDKNLETITKAFET